MSRVIGKMRNRRRSFDFRSAVRNSYESFVTCPHCGHQQELLPNREAYVCHRCGEIFIEEFQQPLPASEINLE